MDIANAGEPVILPTARILPVAREPLPQPVGPSNRVNAVGQMAKSAVHDARSSGFDLPANATGDAASRIARGADPETVFSAMMAETAPADEQADFGTADITAGDGAESGATIAAEGETVAADSIIPTTGETGGLDSSEAALDILADNPETRAT